MKVLYVGGTGTISASCVRHSVDAGMQVFALNRGQSATRRPLPESVTLLTGDIRDPESTRTALAGHEFDAVVDLLSFTAEYASAGPGDVPWRHAPLRPHQHGRAVSQAGTQSTVRGVHGPRPDPEVDAVIDRLVEGYHQSARVFTSLAPRPSSAGDAP
jgi:uncharacterized protein YbjT (DUF2867 family)